jgi:nuclear pore complex protein Nup188
VDSPNLWLPELRQQAVVQCLLTALVTLIELKTGVGAIQSALVFFLILVRNAESAEMMHASGVNKQLCLLVSQLYPGVQLGQTRLDACMTPDDLARCTAYRLYITFTTAMLSVLGADFVLDALDFVGVHTQRMHECFECTGLVLVDHVLLETEESCRFLATLAAYRREWRLHLPTTLQTLMTHLCGVVQKCAALLNRTRLDTRLGLAESGRPSQYARSMSACTTTPLATHLVQTQASVEGDQGDSNCPELFLVQNRLLHIVAQCLLALRRFSPALGQALLDPTYDMALFDRFVLIGFGNPSADADVALTFGTFVSIFNVCLKFLSKTDATRLASPQKPATPRAALCENYPIKRPLVMFCMENALYLAMSHAARYLRDKELPPRDKQLLKRELGAELNSCMAGLQRYLRCLTGGGQQTPSTSGPPGPLGTSPSTPGARGSTPGTPGTRSSALPAPSFTQEHAYFRLVDLFVQQILK